MQKWAYHQVTWDSDNNGHRIYAINGNFDNSLKNRALHSLFNDLGAEGWELVAVDWDAQEAFFKRPSG